MRITRRHIWFLSFSLILISTVLGYLGAFFWYGIAVVGTFFLFDNLSSKSGNYTTLDLINDREKNIFVIYTGLVWMGFLIEAIGNYILGFWFYPKLGVFSREIFVPLWVSGQLLGYPVILASFREMYRWVRARFKPVFSTIISMVLGIAIWEIPNLFTQDWVYTIPYINIEPFGINIVVILGWILLIQGPVIFYEFVLNFGKIKTRSLEFLKNP